MQKTKKNWFMRFLKYMFPCKGDSFKEILRKIIFIISLIVIILSSIYIAKYIIKHVDTEMSTRKLRSVYNTTIPHDNTSNLPDGYLSKFAGLYDINSDIKGWINIPNTQIDYPVTQYSDNDFYLNRDFEKEYDPHGIPYIDYRAKVTQDKTSKNIVLYAHNVNGGKLFGDLNKYREMDFYKQNPIINFDTVYQENKYKIFGVFVTDVNTSDSDYFAYHNFIESSSNEDFYEYINNINIRSLYQTGITINPNDELLTFSTCANELKDGRFVVVARKLREGEADEIDVNLVSTNPSPLYPQQWYDKFGGQKPIIS